MTHSFHLPRNEGEPETLKRPLRLVMATARYPPFTGGIELHVDHVARRLAARGVDVTILTTDPTGTLPVIEEVGGAHVTRVRAWPPDRDYYFAPDVYRVITHDDWDLVHVQGYHTFVAPLAMLASRRARLPYVLTFHAGGLATLSTWRTSLHHLVRHDAGNAAERLRRAVRPLQFSILSPLLRRADRLVALAPFEIEHYADRLGVPRERFALIPNGSDLPRPGRAPTTRPKPTLIATVGRLERAKGHHRVLAAFPHVLHHRPETRLWIAGDGSYKSPLRQLAGSLGVADRVDIHAVPADDRQRFADELSQVALVILMSEFETQPLAALEALSLGCRLVVADTPGLRTLADEGFARVVPLQSPPAVLAAAILEELEQPSRPLPFALPTWDACADALLEVYDEVIRDHPRTSLRRVPHCS